MTDHYNTDILAMSLFLKDVNIFLLDVKKKLSVFLPDVKKTVSIFTRCKKPVSKILRGFLPDAKNCQYFTRCKKLSAFLPDVK